jgi:glutathione synthase/RimK-type ligase-like ATP-grasp enzyme
MTPNDHEQGTESHDDFLHRMAAVADNAFSITPYKDMAKDAWLNVVKALYPHIAKHAQEHVIQEDDFDFLLPYKQHRDEHEKYGTWPCAWASRHFKGCPLWDEVLKEQGSA